jgi:hypothetical protein
MRGEHPIGEELAELGLRPSVHEELPYEMKVGARVDVVGDARRDDRQDIRRALGAFIEPCKEPVLPAEDEASQLALASVVGRLDVAVV